MARTFCASDAGEAQAEAQNRALSVFRLERSRGLESRYGMLIFANLKEDGPGPPDSLPES